MIKTILLELGRALLKLALDRTLREALPKVYSRLDAEMPLLLPQATPTQMAGEIASAIGDATDGKVKATTTQIAAVISLYDPIKAVVRNLKK
jgi:hypothetical protein